METGDKKIAAEEQRVLKELEKHRIAERGDVPAVKQKATAPEERPNLEEAIHRRAYQLYEKRGREDGRDLDDWLRAEAEIAAKNSKSAAA
jgi:hypothetical protein